MLPWLLDHLAARWPSMVWSAAAATAEKTAFRAWLAALVAFAVTLVLGPRLIAWLGGRFREPNKSDSPTIRRLHRDKRATPTMGGLLILSGLLASVLVFGDLSNGYLQTGLMVATGLALIGLLDDLIKLRRASNGMSARSKLLGQVAVAGVAAAMVYAEHASRAEGVALRVSLAGNSFSLGLWFIPLAMLVIVGFSNAVNLTDGLDGLAGGCVVVTVAAMTLVAYAADHAGLAEYFGVPHLAGTGEVTVLAGAMLGGVVGFLWFNCHPAQVFMGDTGSLPLGGLLGLLAVITRQELLLLLVGGVFVVEAGSVVLQVGCYKWRRRRILLCAPLHHHFQFRGWPETRIVARFWIASVVCAALGLAALKLSMGQGRPQSQPRLPARNYAQIDEVETGLPPKNR